MLEGLSENAVEALSAEPLRRYITSATETRGNLLMVPDLRRVERLEEWQRDAGFRDLVASTKTEGLKSLLIIGLFARSRTYGFLLVGWRQLHVFGPEQMQLAMGIGSQVGSALDNWRLVRTGEWQNEDLRTLDRVGRAMRETFDFQEQMAALRKNLGSLLGGCDFALAMQESPDGPLEVVVPFEHHSDAGTAVGTAGFLEEEVAKTRAPRLVGESWQWSKYGSVTAAGMPQIRTWCGVPIHFSDGSMGVLEAANFERERAITGQQFELVRALANESAGAFENSRTFQRQLRRAKHLTLLNEIGRKATSFLNPRDLLENLCIQVQSAFGHDLVRVEIWDRQSDRLVVEAETGYGNEFVGHRTPLGKGISGEAAERRAPVIVNRLTSEMECFLLAPGVRSTASLPLEYQDELLGVLTLESRRYQAFPEQEVLTLRTLAEVVSNALHNACAYQNALDKAFTDGLTGLKTQRYFVETLEHELRRSQRSGRPFSVIMMELDQLQPASDQRRQARGDRVLSGVASVLIHKSRRSSRSRALRRRGICRAAA